MLNLKKQAFENISVAIQLGNYQIFAENAETVPDPAAAPPLTMEVDLCDAP